MNWENQEVFIENEEEVNEKWQYAHTAYNNISTEKKNKRLEYAREKYRSFYEEEKDKKCQYARQRYRKLSKSFDFLKLYKKLFSLKMFGFAKQAWESFFRG